MSTDLAPVDTPVVSIGSRKYATRIDVEGAPLFVQEDRRHRGMQIIPISLHAEYRSDGTGWRVHHVSITGLTPSGEPVALSLRGGKGELRALPDWAHKAVQEVSAGLRRADLLLTPVL